MRAPYEDNHVLLRYQTQLDSIVDVVGPHSTDEETFLAVLNADGRFKIINYTVIENHQVYGKYVRDNFGVKGTFGPNSTRRLEDTPQGQRMIDQGFPLRFTMPL
jgi:hypothetical protein